jgi:hypothetical protein
MRAKPKSGHYPKRRTRRSKEAAASTDGRRPRANMAIAEEHIETPAAAKGEEIRPRPRAKKSPRDKSA